jgi:hypothetical protein
MSLHAEKVDYADAAEEDGGPDSDLGGVIEEFHTRPECGRKHARRAV